MLLTNFRHPLRRFPAWAIAVFTWFWLLQLAPSMDASGVGSLFKLGQRALKVGAVVGGAGTLVAGTYQAVESWEGLRDMDEVVLQLRAQHAEETDNAIFSVLYHLNGDATAVRWADLLNDPDVFVVVEIEGVGRYVIPDIAYEYKGARMLHTFVTRHALPGQRVAVYLMDDDSFSNAVWNSIVQTRVDFQIEGVSSVISRAVAVKATASGSIQLLDQPMTLDSHDCIAAAVFTVPHAPDGKWWARVPLLDEQNRHIGELEFRQLGQVPWERYQQILRDRRKTKALMVSSGVLALCGLLVFVRFTFAREKPVKANPAQ